MKKSVLLAAVMLFVSACSPRYSTGERVGVVTKLSYKGIIWKSWEGQLNQGGMINHYDGNGKMSMVPNVIGFNVSEPALIEKLKLATESGKRVKLTYNQWLLKPPTISNDHVIIGVEFLE